MSGRVCLYISKLLFNLSLLMGHTLLFMLPAQLVMIFFPFFEYTSLKPLGFICGHLARARGNPKLIYIGQEKIIAGFQNKHHSVMTKICCCWDVIHIYILSHIYSDYLGYSTVSTGVLVAMDLRNSLSTRSQGRSQALEWGEHL